ncbi:TULIP family P47-like protein [Methylobacterium sp. JK268]
MTETLTHPRLARTLEEVGLSPQPRSWTRFRARPALTAAETSQETTTLGWDTTFAIRLPDVNKALTKSGKYPLDFEIMVDPDENYGVKGTFGSWQLARGGSGGILFMVIPIAAGTMTSGTKTYSMNGAKVYISIKLKYLSAVAPKAENPIQETLDLHADDQSRSEEDPAVVIQNMTFPDPKPSVFTQALMKEAMQTWFLKNLSRFSHVFASVNVNEIAAEGDFQWLKPTCTSYAYFEPVDPKAPEEDCVFGVLNMTTNTSPEGLSKQLAPNSIPKGQRSGLNISMSRFLNNVVLPGLYKGFEGATTASFKVTANNQMIVNTGPLKMAPVRSGLIDYTPYVQIFELQVVGDEVQIHTRTSIDISPGIVAWVDTISYQKIVLIDKPDGTQTLDFKQSKDPVRNQWIEKETWVTVTEIIVSIVGAVAAGVAGRIITATVPRIIAVIIILIIAGLAAATPELIALVAGGDAAKALPTITVMVANGTSPVHWPDSKAFKLTSAGLNGAFQLGGDPQFAF